MNDLTVEQSEAIEPITSSADGQRNSYSLFCAARGQSMNYAACLWRQGVLSKPDIKTPEDWNSCRTAACSGTCTANNMREEEVLAGKSIYFRAREVVRRMANNFGEAARQWVMPSTAPKEKPTRSCAAKPTPEKSMLDAMGSMGTLADAVTEAAKDIDPVFKTRGIDGHAKIIDGALPGESPLAMARRIAAGRSATI